ncbi:MAG: M1 family metallopeptidase [Chitinophagaceae bacterium]
MKYFSLIISIFSFFSQALAQQKNTYWQQQVNYNIAVSLNDNDHTIDAIEKISYTNNSPDTLRFIWFHIWQNAYKNDKTAFSEQLLLNGRTDFYFSDEKDRGYTNKLDFKVGNEKAKIEPHPNHIDIVKLLLPKPLAPNQTIEIETPFHSKLPYNFSRGGHIKNDYQLTQWYPKPAVYDSKGWHEMPYLDQGEFYSEFGSFEVTITLPNEYLVAATGELQTIAELDKLKQLGKIPLAKQPNYLIDDVNDDNKTFFTSKPVQKNKKVIKQFTKTGLTKTLIYKQDNVHDFAWFASKNFLVQYDTLQLKSKLVDCFAFVPKQRERRSENNILSIKNTLKNYSKWLGEYPYNIATVVLGKQNREDGMEYPTITYINIEDSSWGMSELISHELGHNWFYGILGSNEREHPWMDEGMNTFFDNKKMIESKITDPQVLAKLPKKYQKKEDKNEPIDGIDLMFNTLIGINKNIPIDTVSAAYPNLYYGLIVYEKAANWLKLLEENLGKNVYDSVMKTYYQQWKFKHPYPQDFKLTVEQVSGKNVDALFAKLNNNESLKLNNKQPFSLGFGLPTNNIIKMNTVSITPAVSYNFYDGVRVGAAIYNYQLPLPKFQFLVNPNYGTNSKEISLFSRLSYNIYKRKSWLEISTSFQKYTYNNFVSEAGDNFNLGIVRFVPSIKYTLYKNDLRSTERTIVGFKTFYLNEQNLNFASNDVITTPSTKSYINRLYFSKFDNRVLYPYNINLTIDQGQDFVRAAFTVKQFFNYPKHKGGIEARFFAGKFFYLNGKTVLKQYRNDRYNLNLSGPKGYEDYTYSDYFIGRGEFDGWRNQQIMERDGFFKVRTDYLGSKIGKTDDWLTALNLNVDCPGFPAIKAFADIGTYAEAWQDNPATGRFLFDAGLQLSLLKNAVNIYFPILNSKVFRDYNKSILTEKIFSKSISFSINLQNLQFNKLSRDIPL